MATTNVNFNFNPNVMSVVHSSPQLSDRTLSKGLAALGVAATVVYTGYQLYKYHTSWRAANATLREILEGNSNAELCEELVEVARPDLVEVDPIKPNTFADKQKRRIRKTCRNRYVREIVAACKAKFGTPTKTEANRKAVRRYATEIMRGDNVRHTNLQVILPLILAATFVPDKYEIAGLKLATSGFARRRLLEHGVLSKLAGEHGA